MDEASQKDALRRSLDASVLVLDGRAYKAFRGLLNRVGHLKYVGNSRGDLSFYFDNDAGAWRQVDLTVANDTGGKRLKAYNRRCPEAPRIHLTSKTAFREVIRREEGFRRKCEMEALARIDREYERREKRELPKLRRKLLAVLEKKLLSDFMNLALGQR